MTPRESTLAKIMAEANDPNVSEERANNAMKMAHDYAAKYGLNILDIKEKSEATDERHYRTSDGQFSTVGRGFDMVDKFLTGAIAKFYACRTWWQYNEEGFSEVFFFGQDADREAAQALRWVCRAAMARAWAIWKRGRDRWSAEELANAKLTFSDAMGKRLAERLAFIHRVDTATPLGNELVVAKDALTNEHFAKLGLNLGRINTRGFDPSKAAAASEAGRIAGDQVNIGTGIGGKRLSIGKS